MTDAAEKLLAEAMKLSPEERERLGRQLLSSTEAANDAIDADELAAVEEALDGGEQQFSAGQGREFFSAIAELRAQSCSLRYHPVLCWRLNARRRAGRGTAASRRTSS